MRTLLCALAGDAPNSHTEPQGAYLVPLVRPDGSRVVAGGELDRCEDPSALGVEASTVSGAGEPGAQLCLAQAARLSGVPSQSVPPCCRPRGTHRRQTEHETRSG